MNVALPDFLVHGLAAKKSSAREAFLGSIARFAQNALEGAVHAVTRTGGIVRSKRHSTKRALEGATALEQPTAKRQRYVKQWSSKWLLIRLFLTVRQLMNWELPGAIHVAVDSARVGGRDSELGCIYHTGADAATWLPPMDRPGE